ncbi:MAG: DUF4032 domain-containing protein [Puniceicoccaceae bacterium]
MTSPDNSPAPEGKERPVLERSSLYREFLAEREEILRHKWLESEKAGKDIGFERALLDWIRQHRDAWRATRRPGKRTSRQKS